MNRTMLSSCALIGLFVGTSTRAQEPSSSLPPQLTGPRVAAQADLDYRSRPGSSRPAPAAQPPDHQETVVETTAVESDPQSAPAETDTRTAELTPELIELRTKVRECLAAYYHQPVSANERSPWGIMHALIAYGVDTEVTVDGRRVNAIGWLCWNGAGRGQRLFYTNNGGIQVRRGAGVQGHDGQFLAMLAQSRVRDDFGIKIDGHEFTIRDLVQYEMAGCRAGTELTFKLIGLSHYLDSDAEWKNKWGESWSVERLIEEELKQQINGAACGGTHRLMGFSYAIHRREKKGQPITGQWKRAQKYINDYHEYTLKLQNADGSFSTSWFRGRGSDSSIERRLQTSGHILEWLAFSVPKEQLSDPKVVQAVDYLATLMLENRNRRWEIGPRGHALHALAIYDERMFGTEPGHLRVVLAGESQELPEVPQP